MDLNGEFHARPAYLRDKARCAHKFVLRILLGVVTNPSPDIQDIGSHFTQSHPAHPIYFRAMLFERVLRVWVDLIE